MATTNIGQYRYAGASSNCITSMSFKKAYVSSNIDITGLDTPSTVTSLGISKLLETSGP